MMKLSLVMSSPDVHYGPLALLQGTFEEKVEKAREMGYSGIELMVRDPRQLDLQFIQSVIKNAGLEVVQIVTGELFGADSLCLVTPSEKILKQAQYRIKLVIELAANLNALVNIGRFRGRLDWMVHHSPEDAYQISLERIAHVVDWASASGVKITLEPINRYEIDFIRTTQEGINFIHNLKRSGIGLMLDLFHMNIEDRSIIRSLGEAKAANLLWHVHVADSNRWYPGRGHLDFQTIIDTLYNINYHGYLSAEIVPFPDPDIAAQENINYLRSLLSKGSE